MANRIVAVQYTSNAGNQFRTGLNEQIWDQGKSGGSTALETELLDPLPKQMKPRRAVMRSNGRRPREIVCLTADAPLYVLGATLTIEDSDGVAAEYVTTQRKDESYRKRVQQPVA